MIELIAIAAVPLWYLGRNYFEAQKANRQFQRDKWTDELALEQRKLILEEQKFQLEQSRFTESNADKKIPEKPSDPMPDDIYLECSAESTSWAKEQAMSHANELYEELGDWQAVRRRMFPGSTEVE